MGRESKLPSLCQGRGVVCNPETASWSKKLTQARTFALSPMGYTVTQRPREALGPPAAPQYPQNTSLASPVLQDPPLCPSSPPLSEAPGSLFLEPAKPMATSGPVAEWCSPQIPMLKTSNPSTLKCDYIWKEDF